MPLVDDAIKAVDDAINSAKELLQNKADVPVPAGESITDAEKLELERLIASANNLKEEVNKLLHPEVHTASGMENQVQPPSIPS